MPDRPAYAPLLLRPDAPAPPVLSLPHSGTRVPEFLACALRPGAEQRLPGCDAHLPELLPDDLPGDLPQGMANIGHQLFFKKRAVETFEMDLGILDKNGMFHVVIFSCIYAKM